jgi:hypothetical protein
MNLPDDARWLTANILRGYRRMARLARESRSSESITTSVTRLGQLPLYYEQLRMMIGLQIGG